MNEDRIIPSPLLAAAGFRHAFFSRRGGVSQGPFESLNFSATVGDDPSAVSENLSRAARDLGVEPHHLFFLNQMHGTHPVTVDSAGLRPLAPTEQGDIVLSRDPSVGCGVRVADCAPVLIADPRTGTAAAVHSGWRGTAQNICRVAIDSLTSLGCQPQDLIAAVGPHIQSCCFEIGDDVAETLSACSPATDVIRAGPRGRPHADLRRIIHAQLVACGLDSNRIDHVLGCTHCEPARLFSFRRMGKRSGRHLCAIVPRG